MAATGRLLESYLSRFGTPTDTVSVETVAFAVAVPFKFQWLP